MASIGKVRRQVAAQGALILDLSEEIALLREDMDRLKAAAAPPPAAAETPKPAPPPSKKAAPAAKKP